MSIATQTPRAKTRRPRRGDDRTTTILTFPAPAPDPEAGDPPHVLRNMLAAAEETVEAAQREVHRLEAERRRAAAVLEADLAPVRIHEAERARRRAVYVAAEHAKTAAASELARARALVDAARLLTDTMIDEGAPADRGRFEPGRSVPGLAI